MAQEFKLKGVDKLELKDLQKVEYEVEGIEGGKVLLCSVEGQVHAVNANCTHFGAPLKNAILTPEGRLTCPWHGGMSIMRLPIHFCDSDASIACFNVKSGDVEDAPAPFALNEFDVVEKDGGVYIKGKEADIKGGKKTVNIKTKPSAKDKLVIVGR